MSKRSTSSKSLLSTQTLILLCVGWAIFALLFFLLFSTPPPGEVRPIWYLRGTFVLEMGAFLGASILCFRNWRSHQIVSGRGVWLAIGLGMFCYFLGDAIFGVWEIVWKQDPEVSPADIFFILTYLFLGWGMLQAVLPRRLHLELTQWGIIFGAGLLGVLIALFVNYSALQEAFLAKGASFAIGQQVDLGAGNSNGQAPQATPLQPNERIAAPGETTLNQTRPIETAPPESDEENPAPAWVIKLDRELEPWATFVTFLYLIGDCILVTIAVTLLVAFWGGRYSESWRLIAIAAFCLYIADMIFAYIVNDPNIEYETGDVWEVFWIFSGVFFALGAAVEYGISTRSRRSIRRKRG